LVSQGYLAQRKRTQKEPPGLVALIPTLWLYLINSMARIN